MIYLPEISWENVNQFHPSFTSILDINQYRRVRAMEILVGESTLTVRALTWIRDWGFWIKTE